MSQQNHDQNPPTAASTAESAAESAVDKSADELHRIRHTVAHVMAGAVLSLYPGAKIAIGPPIENGFYYDFDLPRNLKPEDLAEIELKMAEIISRHVDVVRQVVSRDEAKRLFADQDYKIELVDAIPEGQEVSLYTVDAFTDLCKGPHVANTRELNPKAFKLLSVAGAYWRGDEKRPMLQRIYGTAWKTPKELRAHLDRLAEIEKRDHRKLGKDLDLFSTHEEAGAGLVYWHPKGGRIRQVIEDYWREEHRRGGYEILYTPHVGRSWLWETSGHLDFYKENMYPRMEMDKADFYAKPMNCPFHIMIYQTAMRSYRDLPLRWAELGTVYRYERSGVLHGLLRVRGFTQDDAHIFCTPAQVEDEILTVLKFSMRMWKAFGFSDIKAYLATKPAKSVGAPADWDHATEALRRAIDAEGLPYEMDEGGGAFYGPKIDLKIRDAIGREWQMSTIQFDFNLPERFGMTFVDSDGKEKRPFMVHRALLGSLERFFGVLIEHYGGAFPVWLAPEQVVVIPVAPQFADTAAGVAAMLRDSGFRASADVGDARMNAKIRNAQQQKVPFMAIIGEREQESGGVAVRTRSGEQLPPLSVAEFGRFLADQVKSKGAP